MARSSAPPSLSTQRLARSAISWRAALSWIQAPICVVLPLDAADVVGAKLLGFTAQAVRHLWEADRLGLGETDLERIRFPALTLRQAIEAFTAAAYGERLTFEHE